MRKLKSDIKKNALWERCRLKQIILSATWNVSGVVYVNPYNNMRSVAELKTPIVVTDGSSAYWTISVNEFFRNFMSEEGNKLNYQHVEYMKEGHVLCVCQKYKTNLWAFHVEIAKYRWDCPYNVNQSGYLHGTGDYLVCNGTKAPDLTTMRAVNYEMFKRFYERRSTLLTVLKYSEGKYECSGHKYDTFREGLVAMLEAVTWEGAEYDFDGIDANLLTPDEQKQYLLLMILHGKDLVTIFNSRDYSSYRRYSRVTIPQDNILMRRNPFAIDNLRIPSTYQVNKSMHIAIIPELSELYAGIAGKSFKVGNQVYYIDKLLSYVLDTVLFDVDTTPCVRVMNILVSLTKHKSTAALVDYVSNQLLPKAEILAMQIDVGDYIDQDEILLQSDLRHTRYNSKTGEQWGGNDYVEVMLSLPPSMQDRDYYTWVKNAGDIMGKTLDLGPKKEKPIEEELPLTPSPDMAQSLTEEEMKTVELEDNIEGAWTPELEEFPGMNPPEEIELPPVVEESTTERTHVLKEAARTFCYELNIPEKDIDDILLRFDWDTKESARQFPTFVREKFGVMEVAPMVTFLYAISDQFGSIGE